VKEKQKLIYILSLDHSGSTILDMALGCHPAVVGFGEAVGLLGIKYHELRDRISRCSCGQDIRHCPFWSRARRALLDLEAGDFPSRYTRLMEVFREVFPEGTVAVDSSKRAFIGETFPFFRERFDFRVVLMVRDLRGWIDSRRRKRGGNGLVLGLTWWHHNRRMLRFLERGGYRHLVVGYEELALYPEVLLRTVCDFAALDFHPDMLVPDRSRSHIVRGNLARLDAGKRRRFFYDARWQTSVGLQVQAALLWPLLFWNRRRVYGHFRGGRGNRDFAVFGARERGLAPNEEEE